MSFPKMHRQIGARGEHLAARFLARKGYEIIEQNYIFRHGEIDLIARDRNDLVFVEVKVRRSTRYGMPAESVTPKKQEMLRRTAEGYVVEKHLENVSCRFDVVAIQINDGTRTFVHYKNAF